MTIKEAKDFFNSHDGDPMPEDIAEYANTINYALDLASKVVTCKNCVNWIDSDYHGKICRIFEWESCAVDYCSVGRRRLTDGN